MPKLTWIYPQNWRVADAVNSEVDSVVEAIDRASGAFAAARDYLTCLGLDAEQLAPIHKALEDARAAITARRAELLHESRLSPSMEADWTDIADPRYQRRQPPWTHRTQSP